MTATLPPPPAALRQPRELFWRALPGHFVAARTAAMRGRKGALALGLTPHPVSYYAKYARCYLSHDERCGFAVTHDGDLVSLFNDGDVPGMGREAVLAAVGLGARTLWCFDGFLPRYYAGLGWVETGRIAWSDSMAPKGWPYATAGRPDVVAMTLAVRPYSASRAA